MVKPQIEAEVGRLVVGGDNAFSPAVGCLAYGVDLDPVPDDRFNLSGHDPERREPAPSLTLREWLDGWLERCAHRGLRSTTVASYRTMLRLHVAEELARKPLKSITAQDFNQLYGHLLREGRRDGEGRALRSYRPLPAHDPESGALRRDTRRHINLTRQLPPTRPQHGRLELPSFQCGRQRSFRDS